MRKNSILKDRKFYRPTISKNRNGYFLSVNVCVNDLYSNEKLNTPISDHIGIDVGYRTWMYVSDGTKYNVPNTDRLHKKSRFIQSKITRYNDNLIDKLQNDTNSGITSRSYIRDPNLISRNQKKRLDMFDKINKRIRDKEYTEMNMNVSQIVKKNPRYIVIEGLKVSTIKKKGVIRLNRALDKAKLYTLLECIKEKAKKYDIPVYKADIQFPSTQLCCICGIRNRIGSSKIYKCKHCGNIIDRDYNASINLKNYNINDLSPCNFTQSR